MISYGWQNNSPKTRGILRLLMKALKYLLVYLLIIELSLALFIPAQVAIGYRMDYPMVKDNLDNIDIILGKISQEVKNDPNYIIILGDSVAFSGPGPSSQSLACDMQNLARGNGGNVPRIYNLSLPAMQCGDIYTMLLKLDKYHISTEHIILNVVYAGFVARNPDPPAVFWLKRDLQALDPASFQKVLPNLQANNYNEKISWSAQTHRFLVEHIALFRYKDVLRQQIKDLAGRGGPTQDSLGDNRPWYQKEGLSKLLQQPEYQQGFATQPFDMSPVNPQIYFLDKIMEHQRGTDTLVFLAGVNAALMHDKVSDPAYQDNLAQIDKYFQGKPVQYINFQGKIDPRLFTDHVHLTGEGYRHLARILWQKHTGEIQ